MIRQVVRWSLNCLLLVLVLTSFVAAFNCRPTQTITLNSAHLMQGCTATQLTIDGSTESDARFSLSTSNIQTVIITGKFEYETTIEISTSEMTLLHFKDLQPADFLKVVVSDSVFNGTQSASGRIKFENSNLGINAHVLLQRIKAPATPVLSSSGRYSGLEMDNLTAGDSSLIELSKVDLDVKAAAVADTIHMHSNCVFRDASLKLDTVTSTIDSKIATNIHIEQSSFIGSRSAVTLNKVTFKAVSTHVQAMNLRTDGGHSGGSALFSGTKVQITDSSLSADWTPAFFQSVSYNWGMLVAGVMSSGTTIHLKKVTLVSKAPTLAGLLNWKGPQLSDTSITLEDCTSEVSGLGESYPFIFSNAEFSGNQNPIVLQKVTVTAAKNFDVKRPAVSTILFMDSVVSGLHLVVSEKSNFAPESDNHHTTFFGFFASTTTHALKNALFEFQQSSFSVSSKQKNSTFMWLSAPVQNVTIVPIDINFGELQPSSYVIGKSTATINAKSKAFFVYHGGNDQYDVDGLVVNIEKRNKDPSTMRLELQAPEGGALLYLEKSIVKSNTAAGNVKLSLNGGYFPDEEDVEGWNDDSFCKLKSLATSSSSSTPDAKMAVLMGMTGVSFAGGYELYVFRSRCLLEAKDVAMPIYGNDYVTPPSGQAPPPLSVTKIQLLNSYFEFLKPDHQGTCGYITAAVGTPGSSSVKNTFHVEDTKIFTKNCNHFTAVTLKAYDEFAFAPTTCTDITVLYSSLKVGETLLKGYGNDGTPASLQSLNMVSIEKNCARVNLKNVTWESTPLDDLPGANPMFIGGVVTWLIHNTPALAQSEVAVHGLVAMNFNSFLYIAPPDNGAPVDPKMMPQGKTTCSFFNGRFIQRSYFLGIAPDRVEYAPIPFHEQQKLCGVTFTDSLSLSASPTNSASLPPTSSKSLSTSSSRSGGTQSFSVSPTVTPPPTTSPTRSPVPTTSISLSKSPSRSVPPTRTSSNTETRSLPPTTTRTSTHSGSSSNTKTFTETLTNAETATLSSNETVSDPLSESNTKTLTESAVPAAPVCGHDMRLEIRLLGNAKDFPSSASAFEPTNTTDQTGVPVPTYEDEVTSLSGDDNAQSGGQIISTKKLDLPYDIAKYGAVFEARLKNVNNSRIGWSQSLLSGDGNNEEDGGEVFSLFCADSSSTKFNCNHELSGVTSGDRDVYGRVLSPLVAILFLPPMDGFDQDYNIDLKIVKEVVTCSFDDIAARSVRHGLILRLGVAGAPQSNTLSEVATTTTAAVGVVSAAASPASAMDAQALAVFSLISCASGKDRYAMKSTLFLLSPFAIGPEPDGFLWGNVLILAIVFFIQALVMLVTKATNPKATYVDVTSAARFPSVFFAIAIFLQQGNSILSLRMIVDGHNSFVAWFCVCWAVCFPIGVGYLYRNRAKSTFFADYTQRQMVFCKYDDNLGANWPDNFFYRFVKKYAVPVGRWGPPIQRRRFASVINPLIPTWLFFATMPMLQANVITVLATIEGTTPARCGTQYALLIIMYWCFATVVFLAKPYRSPLLIYTSVVSQVLLSIILINSAILAMDPFNAFASAIHPSLLTIQMLFSVARTVYQVWIRVAERCFWTGMASTTVWNASRDSFQTKATFAKAFPASMPSGSSSGKRSINGSHHDDDEEMLAFTKANRGNDLETALLSGTANNNDNRRQQPSPSSSDVESYHSEELNEELDDFGFTTVSGDVLGHQAKQKYQLQEGEDGDPSTNSDEDLLPPTAPPHDDEPPQNAPSASDEQQTEIEILEGNQPQPQTMPMPPTNTQVSKNAVASEEEDERQEEEQTIAVATKTEQTNDGTTPPHLHDDGVISSHRPSLTSSTASVIVAAAEEDADL